MSILGYHSPHRLSRSTSARTFPERYYNERHDSIDYHRVDPYAVGGVRARGHPDRDEIQPEHGGARRRIAVACARCRKRKIRCSGDNGDGQGCQNCKVAGVEASQCQFHRVGSDHVQNVMDSYNMVQSLTSMSSAHNMMPIYLTGGDGPYHPYSELETKFGYSQLNTRPAYGSDWTAPYGDDTSPMDNYSFDQSQSCPSTRPARAGSNSYGVSYRWTPQAARPAQSNSGYYSAYGNSYNTNELPYIQTDLPPVATNEPISPLNMSSLQLTLPERSRQRQGQTQPTEVTPRRYLPAPQPRPGHGLHHALDHKQDKYLHSSQSIGTPLFSNTPPSYTNAESFAKPLLPWTAANENLRNAVNETTSAALPPSQTPSRAPASIIDPLPGPHLSSVSDNDAPSIAGTASSDLNFSTLPLLNSSLITAPTPPRYSNFRESRELSASVANTQLPCDNSSSRVYTCNAISKRPAFPGEDPSSNLVSGHRYTPLRQPNDSSSVKNFTKKSIESHTTPLLRTSGSNHNNNF